MNSRIGVIDVVVDEHARLVRAEEAARAAYHLHPVIPLGRVEDVVPAIALVGMAALGVETAALGGAQHHLALVARRHHLGALVVQARHSYLVNAVRNVLLAVVVDEQAWVVKLLLERVHGVRPLGLAALEHHEAVGLEVYADVEPPVVVAHGWRPAGPAVGRFLPFHAVRGQEGEAVVGVAYHFPVHQVLGVAHGYARHTGERGTDHVVIVAHADDVGVGIVRADDGVGVRAVAVVRRKQVGVGHLSHGPCHAHEARQEANGQPAGSGMMLEAMHKIHYFQF